MKPEQENELLRTIRSLKKEIAEIKELIAPIAPNKEKLLNMEEACKMIQCSRWTLYRLVKQGLIASTKSGRRTLFTEYAVWSYLNK